MVLLTIVIVVLCAITVVPSFTIPGTVKIWNPVVKQYDLGADLDGGYYAYYYPTGVISETEWKNLEPADQDDYKAHKGLCLISRFNKASLLVRCLSENDSTTYCRCVSVNSCTNLNKCHIAFLNLLVSRAAYSPRSGSGS